MVTLERIINKLNELEQFSINKTKYIKLEDEQLSFNNFKDIVSNEKVFSDLASYYYQSELSFIIIFLSILENIDNEVINNYFKKNHNNNLLMKDIIHDATNLFSLIGNDFNNIKKIKFKSPNTYKSIKVITGVHFLYNLDRININKQKLFNFNLETKIFKYKVIPKTIKMIIPLLLTFLLLIDGLLIFSFYEMNISGSEPPDPSTAAFTIFYTIFCISITIFYIKSQKDS